MIDFAALKTAINGLRSWTSARLKEKAGFTDIPTTVSQLENDAGYLAEHQDLSEYAKTVDIISTPATASVGQTIVVKAVDDTGKPTEWGTVEVATKKDIAALGNVLTFKGSLATVDELPTEGNSLGDVYYIAADFSGYVWIQDVDETERWEQLGPMVDMTNYAEITQSDVDELAAMLE